MKQIKSWAQYYVDLMTKLGLVRFSMFLATGIIVLAVSIQMGVTLFLRGTVDIVDLVRSVFFGLLVTPWAVYFLSIVVDQLEDSRQRLTRMVRKLQDMRERDLELNSQLQENISRLNAQIAETNRAETLRQQAIEDLENEVFQREKAQLHLGSAPPSCAPSSTAPRSGLLPQRRRAVLRLQSRHGGTHRQGGGGAHRLDPVRCLQARHRQQGGGD